MSAISTHVLNLVTGLPARNVSVVLESQGSLRTWRKIGDGRTDADGRIEDLVPPGVRIQTGSYRLTFDVASYFRSQNGASFYPEIAIAFGIQDPAQSHHIPLLIGPFGYTTYRGS
ncbi:5-hydroxyisourate hydrolase [Nitrospira japonica]|uniref:5-hydroxyisourate hydrolase n=1 Tax=Nitrospira japonica TaxID=1325564 RepID=A0A1W1I0J7_9BACT|nr:hydroxyisourate hydrolase [Nitrospira japonica]SLM46504.1 5-hydroxyisourate hydrolase [Nitrospira japonica]